MLLILLVSSPHVCQTDKLFKWASENPTLASFGALVAPLLLGLVLDDIRHRIEDNDERWAKEPWLKYLSVLPDHLFRFMYDEYYYYVEFDGNSAIGLALSATFSFLYLSLAACGISTTPIVFLVVGLAIAALLWHNWSVGLDDYFKDLSIISSRYREPAPPPATQMLSPEALNVLAGIIGHLARWIFPDHR